MHSDIFEETSDPFSYWGEAAWNCGLDFQLDVENGEFQYSIAVRSKADLSVNSSSGTCEDSNGETTVFQDDLPDIEFTIEGVPIMITNEMEITAGASGTSGRRKVDFLSRQSKRARLVCGMTAERKRQKKSKKARLLPRGFTGVPRREREL